MVGWAQPYTLPLQTGPINDYGQTLEATDRGKLSALIQALAEHGLGLVYLASWHDPFGDPQRYAAEVFRAWGLGKNQALLVFLRGADRRWRVIIQAGPAAPLPATVEALRQRAELEANRTRPGYAAVRFTSDLLSALQKPEPGRTRFSLPWPAILAGVVGLAALFFVFRLFCPHCFRPLRRVASVGGILWVCPRCRYTRAGWGRRSGSRRGVYL